MFMENGKPKVFYHGTNNPNFEKFDEKKIGYANDSGWYGHGFYFAYTKGEAEYYGKFVRAANLDINNPFYFTEELLQFDDQWSDIIADMAIFAIQFSDKFPELAKKLNICVTIGYNNDKPVEKTITLTEYAERVRSVYNDLRLEIFECIDGENIFYSYKFDDDYNYSKLRYKRKEIAEKSRITNAAKVVREKQFIDIQIHTPEYFIRQVSRLLTEELKNRGYDGVLQSKYGDEAVCFFPEQVIWI